MGFHFVPTGSRRRPRNGCRARGAAPAVGTGSEISRSACARRLHRCATTGKADKAPPDRSVRSNSGSTSIHRPIGQSHRRVVAIRGSSAPVPLDAFRYNPKYLRAEPHTQPQSRIGRPRASWRAPLLTFRELHAGAGGSIEHPHVLVSLSISTWRRPRLPSGRERAGCTCPLADQAHLFPRDRTT